MYIETVWSWFEGEMIVVMNMNRIVEQQNIGLRPHLSLPVPIYRCRPHLSLHLSLKAVLAVMRYKVDQAKIP